jgi:UDP-N-acetylglucosamine:LPS N-acetylglucosamine transferase
VTPVVACGSNERLRMHLEAVVGVVALGWRDDMPALVGSAACVVQNSGGMTSLESLSAGTPTLTYRPIPGHGITNARALDAAGLVPWLGSPAELEAALARVLVSPEALTLPMGAPSVLQVLDRQRLVVAPELLATA